MLSTNSAVLEYAFARFRNDIYAFVLSRLHDRADAEDVTQQTFLDAAAAFARGAAPRAPPARTGGGGRSSPPGAPRRLAQGAGPRAGGGRAFAPARRGPPPTNCAGGEGACCRWRRPCIRTRPPNRDLRARSSDCHAT